MRDKNIFWRDNQKGELFTTIFERVDDWYIGHVEELPGANTQGKTLEEVREDLHRAYNTWFTLRSLWSLALRDMPLRVI